MKKFLLLLLISSSLNAFAQVSKTVNITAGNLSVALTANEKQTITNLTITGTIDARDFKTMRDDMPVLAVLDISGVNVNAYSGQEGTAGVTSINYPANKIPVRAFCTTTNVGKNSLNTINLPSSITSIGNWSLLNCAGLSSVVIPKSVLSVERSAFNGCTNMSSVVFESPTSITYIDSMAFRNCDKLKTVTIPSTVSIIDYCAFYDCNELSSISFDSNSSLTTIGISAFGYCSKLTNFSILPKVTSIGNVAFLGTNALITVDANNPNYSSINGVLYNKEQTLLIYCPNSKSGSFSIPATVTTIGEDAFYSCNNLASIVIPNSLKTIGVWAFENCKGLTTISIPSSVNSIGKSAFYNCTGLTSIYCFAQKPIDLNSSEKVFDSVNKNTCTLYVPKGSVSDYQYTYQWSEFNNIVEMPGFTFSSNSVKIDAEHGSKANIDITADVAWTAVSDQSWLTVSPGSGSGNGKLTFTATANPGKNARFAKVTVSANGVESRTILVVQSYILQPKITKLYDFDCQYPYYFDSDERLVYDGTYLYGIMDDISESDGKSKLIRIKPDGSNFTVLHTFDFYGNILLTYSQNRLYGNVSSYSGNTFIFKIETNGLNYTKFDIFFKQTDEFNSPLVISNNTIYGSVTDWGPSSTTTTHKLFKANTDGTGYSILYSSSKYSFHDITLTGNTIIGNDYYTVNKVNIDGSGFKDYGIASDIPVIADKNIIYGMKLAYEGTEGYIFKVNIDGTGFTKIKALSYSEFPITTAGSLSIVGNTLYGMIVDNSLIFKINTDGTGYKRIQHDMQFREYSTSVDLTLIGSELFGFTGSESVSSTLFKINTFEDNVTKVFKFGTSSSGMSPMSTLVESGNFLYGNTYGGGSYDMGTIFRINKDGTNFVKLFEFKNKETGTGPIGQLTLIGNTLYGTTSGGVSQIDFGSIFKINVDGTDFTILHEFDDINGSSPNGSLVLHNGCLFGITSSGGIENHGVIFKINLDGTGFSKISDNTDFDTGESPPNGISISNNDFIYGVSTIDYGGVFSVKTDGTSLKKIFEMNHESGNFSLCKPLLINDELYITTSDEGANGFGTIFKIKTDGTGLKILYNFEGFDDDPDSWSHRNNSLMSYNGKLYGTATFNGINDHGYLYSINLDGTGFAKLSDFNGEYGSMYYLCDLIIDDNEDIYGMTTFGGKYSGGIIYKYSLGDPSTSVEDLAEKTLIQVFPNPTNGNLQISFNTIPETETWITVYNATGKAILKYPALNKEENINLKGNKAGLYLIKINQKNYQETFKILLE